MRRPVLILLAALALLLAVPAAAPAATPFTAGTGARPSLAVGADGTGHVVWNAAAFPGRVGYCRVSPGASACSRSELLIPAAGGVAEAAGRAQVFVSPGDADEVVVTASCTQCPSGVTTSKTFRWTSTDGGDSFGLPTQIGSETDVNGLGTLLFDLGNTFVGTNAARVKAAANGGVGVQYASGGVFSFRPSVARVPLPGTLRLVAAVNDLSTVKYGVYEYSGSDSAATINSSANWEVDKTLPAAEPDNSETALNSGPNGLFLTYLSEGASGPRIGLRRFDPGTDAFGLPSYIEGADPIDDSVRSPNSFQDPVGRVHVVWESLHDGGRLRYAVSDTSAAGFSAAANLAGGERFTEPQVAAAADGHGFAAWSDAAGAIRVVPLDPRSESSGSSPSGSGGGAGATPGSTGTDDRDARAPTVKGARIGSRTLRPGQGTDFRFTSSEAGLAVLTIEKRFNGLKVRGKARRQARAKAKGAQRARKVCLPRTKKRLRALRRQAGTPRAYRKLLRKRSCRGWHRVGEIRQRVRPGLNTIAFDGRVAGRRLGRGSYRARLVVTDASGQPSRTETLSFRVVGKKKPAKGRHR